MTDIARIGDNLPRTPATLSLAQESMNRLSFFLREHPTVATPDDARAANEVFGSTQRTLKDMEAERHLYVDPLSEQVTRINTEYRVIRQPIERALDELKRRLTAYVSAEERKRAAEAAQLRAAAEAKEREAREAEAREADAMAAVDVGACEDVGNAIVDADAAFEDYQRAARAAATAEKDVTVRLHDRFGGKARTMRTTEVLSVSDAAAAIAAIGLTEKIADAIVAEARAYRKQHGALPPGIAVQFVRSM
jgi:multidrug efflux pump subunit AcrA (membrane-fusion protein)